MNLPLVATFNLDVVERLFSTVLTATLLWSTVCSAHHGVAMGDLNWNMGHEVQDVSKGVVEGHCDGRDLQDTSTPMRTVLSTGACGC